MSQKSIYIVLSRTSTRIAKTIRAVGRANYSHAAVSLDEHLSEIYGFSRENYHTPLLGKLVKESLTSYTLNKDDAVPVKVFKIPVSEAMHKHITDKTMEILNDPDFIYNLISVATYPISRGFETYKAFSCIEFVMMILKEIGFDLDKPLHHYVPDDLLEMLKEYEYYEGDIRGIMSEDNIDIHFFEPVPILEHVEVVNRFYILCKRSISKEISKFLKEKTL